MDKMELAYVKCNNKHDYNKDNKDNKIKKKQLVILALILISNSSNEIIYYTTI